MKKLGLVILMLCLLFIGRAVPASGALPTFNTWYATSTGITNTIGGDATDVNALAISPNFTTDHVIYAGAYDGLFRSKDSGFTWTKMGLIIEHINSVTLSPGYATDKTLYVGAANGVFVANSADTDTYTVSEISGNLPSVTGEARVIACSPDYGHDHTVFAGTPIGLYKTTNVNGLSTVWTYTGSQMQNNSHITGIVFTPDYATSHTLFVSADYSDAGGGVYRSTNGGNSWTEIVNGMLPDDPVHRVVQALAISPNYAMDHTLFAGLGASQGIFKSTNGGNSWSLLPGAVGWDTQALALSPNYGHDGILFVGGSGVNVSTDGGASWAELNNGFTSSNAVLVLAIPPGQSQQPFNLFAGRWADRVWQMAFRNYKVFLPMAVR